MIFHKFSLFIITFISIVIAAAQLEDACVLSNGKNGVCVSQQSCPEIKTDAVNKIECGNNGVELLYCCEHPYGAKANKYCKEYTDYKVDFGRYMRFKRQTFRPEVVGGEPARTREFLHMASLGYGDVNNKTWLCGGSLISRNFVMTAAHCARNRIANLQYVYVGDVNLLQIGEDSGPQHFNVKTVYVHPDYKILSKYNDIALIEIDGMAEITPYVRPACLHTEKPIDSSATLTVAGYGRLAYLGEFSSRLQKAQLQIYDHDNCTKYYENDRNLQRGVDDDTQICAGEEGKDACQGDSGGPLQIKHTNVYQHIVVGVTSFGKACGISNIPGVYTRVSHYIPWIESIVWP